MVTCYDHVVIMVWSCYDYVNPFFFSTAVFRSLLILYIAINLYLTDQKTLDDFL